jgi:Lrp/AsnC family transcriptional regulator, leucine-responsive regulatory protein
MMSFEPDDRDQLIMDILEADAWTSYAALARRVHLSASAVQRRVERLIREGVIVGARAEIAPGRRAGTTIIFLQAELVDDSATTIRNVTRILDRATEVLEAHYVTGEADILVKLRVKDLAVYDGFVERAINGSAYVRRFKTMASLRALK